jgi:zinc and cadmium transporter
MSTLGWIVVSGVAMSALALVGSLTLVLPERTLKRILLPLVALAAGSLLGGAFFHMLPESIETLGNVPSVYVWMAAGFFGFFVLEQLLDWHHCHRSVSEHKPIGHLILLADAAHNLIGGLAVGSAFVVDIRLGMVTWLVAATHEIPQELGDFGILVHSGWRPVSALLYNLGSALTFLVGSLIAYAASGSTDVAVLVPFAAGNFIYIAAADLLPQVTSNGTTDATRDARDKAETTVAFLAAMTLLFAVTAIG